jgi:nucleotide-binding universal stress UspA family protein
VARHESCPPRFDVALLDGYHTITRGFARILVPTDFSPPSGAALATAGAFAAQFGAWIHLIHVLEDPYTTAAFASDVHGYVPPGLRESWRKEAQTQLEALLDAPEKAQFHVTTSVIVGSPARAIVDYARDNGVDLIVMGTHGRTGLVRAAVGSVAETVVRAASCPVLTVHWTEPATITVDSQRS